MPTLVRQLPCLQPVATASGSLRNFVSFIRDSFEMAGFVNQFAPGAVDTSSVSPITTTNRAFGYDVFAFNDSFQATHPMFIRVEYRNGGDASIFGLRITVGELYRLTSTSIDISVDVATNFMPSGSNVISIFNRNFSGPNTPQSQSCMSSGRLGNQLSVSMYPWASGTFAALAQHLTFNIERTRDWHGNIVPSGVIINARAGVQTTQLYYNIDRSKSFVNNFGTGFLLFLCATTGTLRPVVQPIITGKLGDEPPALGVIMSHQSESIVPSGGGFDVSSSLRQAALQFGDVTYNYVRLPTPMGGQTLTNALVFYPSLLMVWE